MVVVPVADAIASTGIDRNPCFVWTGYLARLLLLNPLYQIKIN
jgi:hypothetical protein